jgi:hypothetical protein
MLQIKPCPNAIPTAGNAETEAKVVLGATEIKGNAGYRYDDGGIYKIQRVHIL